MGRMLNALRQIESRKPESPGQKDVTGAVAVDVKAECQKAEPISREDEHPTSYDVGHSTRDPAAMESLLIEAQQAAAQALEEDGFDVTERPANSCSADESDPACPAAHVAKPKAMPDPLGDLAETVLQARTPGKAASYLFTAPDSDRLGIDLLLPLSMSMARRLDGDFLLIDTNLRHPALAARLGVEASRGLTDVLSGSARWHEVVRHTVLPGVDLLPAVPFSTPAGPLPERLNLEQLLAVTTEHYALVLIHGPSLRYPEVAPMASHCGGVYLVVRLHETTRRSAAEAAAILRRADANLLGCIAVQ